MSRKILFALTMAFASVFSWFGTASAESSQQQGVDIFLGSPFLILGILAGLVAAGFAFYSASQMKGSKIANVLVLLGVALLFLDIGVMTVTFFAVDATGKLIHDLGLLGGFVLALVAFSRLRQIVG